MRISIVAAVLLLTACGSNNLSEAYNLASAVEEEVESLKSQLVEAETKIDELEERIDSLETIVLSLSP